MSYGSAIQFYGIEAAVDAYVNKGTPAFAIWCGKQLQMRYDGTYGGDGTKPSIEEGAQLLRSYLEAIYQGSTALYTLKTYDEIGTEKIRPSTEYDTAFNFKLGGPVEMGGGGYGMGRVSPVMAEIAKLNARFDALTAEDSEEDDDPETLQDVAIGLLNEPEKLRDTLENIKGLVDIGRALFGFSPVATVPGSLGAVTRAGETNGSRSAEDKYRDLEVALNTLEKYDPDLVGHLTKLAGLAESNPAQFKSLLGILEKL
jgi:hypothetical protein